MADYTKTQVALLPAAPGGPDGLPFTTANGYTSLPPMKLFLLYDPANLAKNYVFDATSPLNGTGILVVFGSLTIALNSNSTFNGMVVVVKGSYSQSAPSTVNGSVIVDTGAAGTVQIQGSGDRAYIRYDPNLLSFMASRMGLYRVTRSPYQP